MRRIMYAMALGAYTRGTDPRVDLAINAEPAINALLQQGMKQVLPYDESLASMAQLAGGLGKGGVNESHPGG